MIIPLDDDDIAKMSEAELFEAWRELQAEADHLADILDEPGKFDEERKLAKWIATNKKVVA